MKTPILILPFLLLFGLFSCNQIDPAPIPGEHASSRMTKLDHIITHQAWDISFLWNAGEDATEMANGFVFEFKEDRTFIGMNGNSVVKGVWNTSIEQEGPILKLDVSYPEEFIMLTRHWNMAGNPYQEFVPLQLQDVHTSKRDSYFLTFIPHQ